MSADRPSGTPSERQQRFFALLKDAAASAERTGPTRRRTQGPARLSFAQESLWFLDRVLPGQATYNMPYCYRLRGDLDVTALRAALTATVRRHDSLRTYLVQDDEGPVQIVLPDIEVPLPVVDIEGPDAAYARAGELVQEPFDLATPPLWRAALYRLGPHDHVFVFVVHHTTFDGWSIGVFTGDLEAAYRAAVEGGGTTQEPPAIQYPDFAEWQREWLRGPNLDRLTGYWRDRLSDAPIFELPGDRPRGTRLTYSGTLARREFAPDLAPAVTAFARAAGTTPNVAFVTAFMALLHRYTGSEDVIIGSPTAGRDYAEVEPLIGFFITMLVLRADVSGEPSFRALLDRVKDVVNGALDHSNLPFERLVDAVRPERDPARSPLFQIAFTFQNVGDTTLRLPGLEAEERVLDLGTSRFDMSWNLYADETAASVVVEFNTDLYDRATIERLMAHYERLLRAMVSDPDIAVGDAPMLTEEELRALLHDFDGPVSPRPDTVVTELFERQVDRAPDAVALTAADATLDYAELEARANRLAHRLRELGAGPEQIVAICLPRRTDLTIAMLAVLKSGAAYLPLDPANPAGRLRGILQDAEPVALIADPDVVPQLPLDVAPLVRPGEESVTRQPDTRPASGVRPENIAYVIYTSGSTGQPKGVLVTHQNVVNFIGTVQDLFHLTPQDRILGYASAVFDVSVFETFSALLTGARLYLTGDEERLSVGDLQQVLETEGITVIDMPPSVMALLSPETFRELRIAFVGGEAFSGELVNRWNPGRRFFNGYGPTECTVTMIVEECDGRWAETPPIGLPMANHVAHVLDAKLRPVPYGVPGELVIGGAGLARGYLKRPELTAEKFVKDPFGTAPGGRLYRTGDLVKRLPDGRIVFLGRIDTQVKIRGLRIELGEIEAVLAGHASVRQAVVRTWTDAREDKHLVGYVVPAEGHTISVGSLRTHLAEYLPPYMIPNFLIKIDALPLTASGKTDWARLPEPDTQRGAEERTGPRNETERILAEEICTPLVGDGAVGVGVEDNFFLVGGNSLHATQLIYRASRRFGVDLTLSEFFRQPTLAQLAVMVDRARLALLSEEEQLARLEAMPDEEVARLLGTPVAPQAEEPAPAEPAPAVSPWEELVTEAVAAELGLPDLTGSDRFMTVGGHSMAAIRVVASLRQLCGVQIPLRVFMGNASVAELAEALHDAAVDQLGADAVAGLLAALNGAPSETAGDGVREE